MVYKELRGGAHGSVERDIDLQTYDAPGEEIAGRILGSAVKVRCRAKLSSFVCTWVGIKTGGDVGSLPCRRPDERAALVEQGRHLLGRFQRRPKPWDK